MNRKQRRANKVKPFQSLGKNMVALPNMAVLNSDAQFEDKGYVKVRFPVNETSKQKGIGSERMWVKITEGDKSKGVGILENEPAYSDFKLFQTVAFEECEHGIAHHKAN